MPEQWIKPYGDTLNDGLVQLSFTLPVENGPRAIKAARIYAGKLNLKNVTVACAEAMDDAHTFFVAYGRAEPAIDYSEIRAEEATVEHMDFYEINDRIRKDLNRRICVVGATIGSDAHTVGIDAIMNMKGYNQDYGLERYPEIDAYNMGAQVTGEDLLKTAMDINADALLVSQTVTQKDAHLHNFTELMELLEAEQLRDRFLVIAGGPRITHELAIELGYDAGFGPGTLPSQVAAYIVTTLIKRRIMLNAKC